MDSRALLINAVDLDDDAPKQKGWGPVKTFFTIFGSAMVLSLLVTVLIVLNYDVIHNDNSLTYTHYSAIFHANSSATKVYLFYVSGTRGSSSVFVDIRLLSAANATLPDTVMGDIADSCNAEYLEPLIKYVNLSVTGISTVKTVFISTGKLTSAECAVGVLNATESIDKDYLWGGIASIDKQAEFKWVAVNFDRRGSSTEEFGNYTVVDADDSMFLVASNFNSSYSSLAKFTSTLLYLYDHQRTIFRNGMNVSWQSVFDTLASQVASTGNDMPCMTSGWNSTINGVEVKGSGNASECYSLVGAYMRQLDFAVQDLSTHKIYATGMFYDVTSVYHDIGVSFHNTSTILDKADKFCSTNTDTTLSNYCFKGVYLYSILTDVFKIPTDIDNFAIYSGAYIQEKMLPFGAAVCSVYNSTVSF